MGPAVLVPATMETPIMARGWAVAPGDDGRGCVVGLDYDGACRGDHDRRWRYVDRDTAGADEAPDHTTDKPA
jgi:hypothetical protein